MSPLKRGEHTKRKIIKGKRAGRLRGRRLKALDLDVHQWIRVFSLASVLLMAAVTLCGILLYNHYHEYPGKVERDSIRAKERGADYIVLTWDETHTTDFYKVFCREHDPSQDPEPEGDIFEKKEVVIDESWRELESDENEIKVDGLEEDKSYSFIVRSDNSEHEGIGTEPRNFKTKKPQTIEVTKRITKLTSSKPFRLDARAETGLMFESSDTEVADIDPDTGEVTINGPGTVEFTIKAKTTVDYVGAEKAVDMRVLKSDPVKAGGASARIIYHLDSDNCEVVKRITGSGGAVIPQGLAYTGDKYIVSYGMGSPNRIVSFDVEGDGKSVSVPKIALGHPNGFTYADENGRCYCVKGWSSKAVMYEPTSGKYSSVSLPRGCSGIGYDRKEKLLYTCSRTVMAAYDISDGYKTVRTTGVVKHSGHTYTQDCGGHAGIMLRCLSGSNKHGTNYIDLYDMKNGRYLGSFSCDLSEVESCIVNKDGFLEILANNSGSTDYIWRTDINIETIGEGL